MNFIKQLLKHLKREKYIHHLKTISGGADSADMELISNTTKELGFYYV